MDQCVFWKVTVSDIIQIIGLGITVWIAIIVQTNLTKNRYLKDYFIIEVKNLKEEYRTFFNALLNSSLDPYLIKKKLKILSLKIDSLNRYANKCFSLKPSELREKHFKFQRCITESDDFNGQYKEGKISYTESSISDILDSQVEILDEMTKFIIDINSASKKFRCRKKHQYKLKLFLNILIRKVKAFKKCSPVF